MRPVLGLAMLAFLLSSCGVAGTGAAGASGAAAEDQQAAQARKIEARVPEQLQAAEDLAVQQRREAEQQGQ